jgi:hypothetical protein
MFSKFHCHIAPQILRKALQFLLHEGANHRFEFQKRGQLFIRAVSARPLQDQTHRELVYRSLQFHERS